MFVAFIVAIYAVAIFVIVRKTQKDAAWWYAPLVTLLALGAFVGAGAAVAAFTN